MMLAIQMGALTQFGIVFSMFLNASASGGKLMRLGFQFRQLLIMDFRSVQGRSHCLRANHFEVVSPLIYLNMLFAATTNTGFLYHVCIYIVLCPLIIHYFLSVLSTHSMNEDTRG